MKKTVKYTLISSPVLFVMPLQYAYLAYPAEYVNRPLRWDESEVYDYQKFPERALDVSDSPFEFSLNLDEGRVRIQFEAVSATDDFDSFLSENRTQAFIMIRDDAILYEHYFNETSRASIVTSFSIAKSFISTLIGIAISEGNIHSVDDPITDYLPELAERDPAFKNITIRDLLMMSSGIKYEEFPFVTSDNTKTYWYPNLRQLALEDTKIADSPGEMIGTHTAPLSLQYGINRRTQVYPCPRYSKNCKSESPFLFRVQSRWEQWKSWTQWTLSRPIFGHNRRNGRYDTLWIHAPLNGVQEVGGSNPLAPGRKRASFCRVKYLNFSIKNPNPALDWPCPRGVYSWGRMHPYYQLP